MREDSRAVSGPIGPSGLTLHATDANGTVFTLEIPAGSVPEGTVVTITPLATVSGTAWAGRLVGAVQLGPEGQVLARGGTLTITPKHAVSVSGRVAFGYRGTGTDLHEVPLDPHTNSIRIPLAHFSGAGASQSSGGPPTPPTPGSTMTDFYEELIAETLQEAKEGRISDKEAYEESVGYMREALREVIQNEVPPGLESDSAAKQAISDMAAIARNIALLLNSRTEQDELEAEVQAIEVKLIEGIYKRAQQRCANEHDLEAIATIREALREELLRNVELHTDKEDFRCLRFKVKFDSLVIFSAGEEATGQFTLEYRAEPTVEVEESAHLDMTGEAAGSYAKAEGTISGSEGSLKVVKGNGAPFKVLSLELQINPEFPVKPTISIEPGDPSETISEGAQTKRSEFWLDSFLTQREISGDIKLQRGEPKSELVAVGSFNGTLGPYEETTTIEVFHTPPPPPK